MYSHRYLTYLFLVLFSLVSLLLLSLPSSVYVFRFKAILFYCLSHGPLYAERISDHLKGIPSNAEFVFKQHDFRAQAEMNLRERLLIQAQLEKNLSENRRFRELLGLVQSGTWDVMVAQVVSRDLSGWFRSLLVDHGGQEGVVSDQAVLGLSDGKVGLAGRVVEVAPHVSKVLLMIDELSSVAAVVGDNQEQGLVEGDSGAILWMKYLAGDAPVRIGDAVYTSRLSQVFPPHVLIGWVTDVQKPDPIFGFQSLRVKPAVRFSALNDVMILKKER